MDPKIIKKTQDSLGKYVKKPPLTEKLLSKPPFRFLHDITTSVIKSTGFMKGLFTEEEMVSDNVKERESKIAFLQKIIDMVSLVLGRTIAARPGKIVAGQEAEKTNELLQALGEAIGKKVNNAEYVQRVLKTSDKPASASKKDGEKRRKEKDDQPKSKSREDREKSKDRGHEKSKDRHKESSRDKEKEKDRDRHRERSHDKEREKSRDKERERHHDKDRSRDRRERDKSRDKGRERESREKGRERDGDSHHKDREHRKRREEKAEVNGAEEQQGIPPSIPRPSSAKGSRRRHGHADDDSSDEEEEQIRQIEREKSSRRRETIKEDDVPPQVASHKTLRPSSARPAPPKVKKNEGQDEAVFLGSSNVPNLITDKDNSDDDEDEGFITKDDDDQEPLMSVPPRKQEDDIDSGEHGGLVKKMLETKKELEGGSQQPGHKVEIERPLVNDVTRRKERELIQKEIDKLRSSIQTLTRSVNPLGKILDFVQEDLDSMHKEFLMWQAENRENSIALQREQSITESSIEPLKAQLKELEAATSDQLDLIAAVKHNILRNDEKIEKMLSTVTKS